MTQDETKDLGLATPREIFLFNLLVERFGMKPARAAFIAKWAWGRENDL